MDDHHDESCWCRGTHAEGLHSISLERRKRDAALVALESITEVCRDAGWDPMDNMPLYLWLTMMLPQRGTGPEGEQ